MKNKNIEKINQLGKIGRILSAITIAISIVGIVIMIMCSIVTANTPTNLIDADLNGTGTIGFKIDENGKKPKIRVGEVELFGVDIMDNNGDVLEEINVDEKIGNMNVKMILNKDEEKSTEDMEFYSTEVSLNGKSGFAFNAIIILICCSLMITLLCFTVSMFFLKKLCKALEKCESPFEENVVKKIKAFAISLIPWGVVGIGLGGISAVGIAVIVIVVLLFSAIFNYGAELQKESDETL